MALTLLEIVKRVAAQTKLIDPTTITAFSYDDETQNLVDYINRAVDKLKTELPTEGLQFLYKTNGSISTVASTRLYSLASDTHVNNIFTWSFEDDTNTDNPLQYATLEYIKGTYPNYDSDTGKPQYFYIEDTQIGLYPIPDATYTIKYFYQETPTALSATSATFPFPDDWLGFVVDFASYLYKDEKSIQSAGTDLAMASGKLAKIYGEVWAKRPEYVM